MDVQYTLSFKEFAEGIKPLPKTSPATKRNRVLRLTAAMIVGGALGILLESNLLAGRGGLSAGRRPVEFPVQNLWTTLAPPLAMAGFFLFAYLSQALQNWRLARAALAARDSPVDHPPSVLLGLAILLPLGFFILPNVPALAIDWKPSPGAMEVVQVAPWWCLLFVPRIGKRFTQFAATIKAYATQRSQRRQFLLEIDEDSITLRTGPDLHRLAWISFDRYHETKNVLKLITEDETIIIIPKRAILNPGMMITLRSIVQTKISHGTFLPMTTGFTVLPQPSN